MEKQLINYINSELEDILIQLNLYSSRSFPKLNYLIQKMRFQLSPWATNINFDILLNCDRFLVEVLVTFLFQIYQKRIIIFSLQFDKYSNNLKKILRILASKGIEVIFISDVDELRKLNIGLLIQYNASDVLFSHPNLYNLGRDSLVELRTDGELKSFGEDFHKTYLQIVKENINNDDRTEFEILNISEICKEGFSEVKSNIDSQLNNFDYDIQLHLDQFSELRFARNHGLFLRVGNAKLFSNLVLDKKYNIFYEALMPHNLAAGYENIQELIEHSKSTSLSKRFHGTWYRAPSPSLSLSHWYIDILLPLISLIELGFHLDGFFYDGTLAEYQINHLKLLGFEKEQIIELKYKKLYQVESCITNIRQICRNPAFSFASIHAPKFQKEKIDRLFKPTVKLRRDQEFIYSSRRDSKSARILINEDEVEKYFFDKNFRIIVGSSYDELELRSIYSHARFLAGPLGANLINSVYMDDGANILALTSSHYYEAHLVQIAALKSSRLFYCVGESISSYDPVEGGYRNSNYYIDIDKLNHIFMTIKNS